MQFVELCEGTGGYLEQTLNEQTGVIFEGGVSPAEARALPLSQGEKEAECPHNLSGNNKRMIFNTSLSPQDVF